MYDDFTDPFPPNFSHTAVDFWERYEFLPHFIIAKIEVEPCQ